MNERSLFKTAVITVISLWFLIFVFVPNILVFGVSFLERHENNFVTFSFTLENYQRIFSSVYFTVFADSFRLALISMLICLVVGYPFAYRLARLKGRVKNILFMLIIIPFWTSSLIRTYAIMIVLKTNGLLNTVLLWLGIISEPLNLLYTGTAVTIGMVYSLLPFMILPLYASIEKLDKVYIEAAGDLGAGKIQTFIRVIIPLTMPGIIAGCTLVFLPSFCLFYIPDLMGGAKDLLIGNLIKNQFLSARDWPFGSAVSVVLSGIMAVLLFAYYKSTKIVQKASEKGAV
ncbi:spermidine/putrescine ABC transporter permease PotB [Geovibrio thiophilus]|uniref:Spermidine/putrescine ABC transporter permease PotB n=1 Tax=Geovibrio thiophilus TaxID=139438 RepID=A0A410K0B6_9BACT|nr:spermidine/putrescine ABC transporter permease PotB [Geovibrio thiophilus]QAR33877.1 spermidine/putrescine ABC transporter permease PotB [Geovibrio thiophilus]